MRRKISALLSLLPPFAVVLVAAPGAHAMLITHSSDGTLFNETYETQVVNSTPTTGLISPDGNGETWSSSIGGSPIGSTLTWDAGAGGPAANEGDQYVRLERVS